MPTTHNSLVQKLKINTDQKNILFIGGPTASGKTSLAVQIAQEFKSSLKTDCSIISADSRQIYIGMTICTAKPLERQTLNTDFLKPLSYQGVDHYLLDFVEPDQRYTLFDFKEQAEQLIKKLHTKNHKVIIAGGTGLYIDALINNYQHQAESTEDPIFRKQIEAEYQQIRHNFSQEKANKFFWERLKSISAKEAQNTPENNWQGVLRAIEVIHTTGEAKSSLSSKSEPNFNYQLLVLNPPRQKLYDHINKRCLEMFQSGLIQETKTLLQKFPTDHPSMTSIGYREVNAYLEGEITREEAIQKFQKSTRNYAKRQLTWFRRYKDHPHTQFIDSYKILTSKA